MPNRAYKIVNIRSGGQYSLMACDLAIGYTNETGEFVGEFVVNGIFLKQKKDGSGYYYDAPFKFRTDRNTGERLKDKNGYDAKDMIFDLYMEKGVGPTKEAFTARKTLIEALVSAYKAQAGETAGRGSAAKPQAARPARPAAAAAKVESPAVATPPELDNGEDDEFPFF